LIKRINYILGTPFCGSTLLAHTLASSQGLFNCGEIDRVEAFESNEYVCNHCPNCALAQRPCPVFTPEVINSLSQCETPYAIYEAFHAISDMPILLDGSKHTFWLRKMVADSRVKPLARAIVLLRSPDSFIESYLKHEPHMNNNLWRPAEIWRDTYYDILRTLHNYRLPYITIRFEDYLEEQERYLELISEWCGIPSVKHKPDYDFSQSHTLGGNPRLAKKIVSDKNLKVFAQPKNNREDIRQAIMQTPGLHDLASNIFNYQFQ